MGKQKIPKMLKDRIIRDSQYYEAIIQVRNPSDELINFINNQLNKKKDIFISNIVPQKEGFDIFISSQRFARSLGNRMKKAFRKSQLKNSRSIFTRNRQTSKDVYRVCVMFRLNASE